MEENTALKEENRKLANEVNVKQDLIHELKVQKTYFGKLVKGPPFAVDQLV